MGILEERTHGARGITGDASFTLRGSSEAALGELAGERACTMQSAHIRIRGHRIGVGIADV
jgi:hypothetical protein